MWALRHLFSWCSRGADWVPALLWACRSSRDHVPWKPRSDKEPVRLILSMPPALRCPPRWSLGSAVLVGAWGTWGRPRSALLPAGSG